MNKPETENNDIFHQLISEKEKRKLKANTEKKKAEWFGLGMFGMVGWSVVVPTFLGTIIGIWLDKNYAQSFSWTLTGLISGLLFGCFIVWNWIIKED